MCLERDCGFPEAPTPIGQDNSADGTPPPPANMKPDFSSLEARLVFVGAFLSSTFAGEVLNCDQLSLHP